MCVRFLTLFLCVGVTALLAACEGTKEPRPAETLFIPVSATPSVPGGATDDDREPAATAGKAEIMHTAGDVSRPEHQPRHRADIQPATVANPSPSRRLDRVALAPDVPVSRMADRQTLPPPRSVTIWKPATSADPKDPSLGIAAPRARPVTSGRPQIGTIERARVPNVQLFDGGGRLLRTVAAASLGIPADGLPYYEERGYFLRISLDGQEAWVKETQVALQNKRLQQFQNHRSKSPNDKNKGASPGLDR